MNIPPEFGTLADRPSNGATEIGARADGLAHLRAVSSQTLAGGGSPDSVAGPFGGKQVYRGKSSAMEV